MTIRMSISGSGYVGLVRVRPRRKFMPALAVDDLDQLDRLAFHLHHQDVDAVAEVAVEDHRRDRHADAKSVL